MASPTTSSSASSCAISAPEPLWWGVAYAIGVTAEMLVLLTFHRMHARFSLDALPAAAFVASALRRMGNAVLRVYCRLIPPCRRCTG